MKKILLSIIIMIGMLHAQEPDRKTYIGIAGIINETYTSTSEYDIYGHSGGEFSNGGFGLIGGYRISDNHKWNYGVELRLGSSFLMEDSEDIQTMFGAVYARGDYRITKLIQLYAMAGVSSVSFESIGDGSVDKVLSGPAVVVGVELLSKRTDLAFFLDYTHNRTNGDIGYFDQKVDFDTISAGVRYEF